jgi:hypothetical protein
MQSTYCILQFQIHIDSKHTHAHTHTCIHAHMIHTELERKGGSESRLHSHSGASDSGEGGEATTKPKEQPGESKEGPTSWVKRLFGRSPASSPSEPPKQ